MLFVRASSIVTAVTDQKQGERARDDPIPSPLPGVIRMTQPGRPLQLFDGKLGLIKRHSGAQLAEVRRGQVTLTWGQYGQLAWKVPPRHRADLPDYWWHDQHTDPAVMTLTWRGLTGRGTAYAVRDWHGQVVSMQFGDFNAVLRSVTAHWMNVPQILPADALESSEHRKVWSGCWLLERGGWQVRIDARHDLPAVYDEARRQRTFAPTHVMRLTRLEDETFTSAQATLVLDGLQQALSFALGRWVCPAVPVGFDETGQPCWAEWSPRHCDTFGQAVGGWWWEQRGDDLRRFLSTFLDAWLDDERRDSLDFLTTAAIAGGGHGYVEQRLLIAGAGIEHLSWVTEVLRDARPADKWRARGAARRARRLLAAARIDAAVSAAHTPALAEFRAREDLHDGPTVITEIRNRLVHPKRPTDEVYHLAGLVADASRLALRYLDLLVLHWLGYDGHVRDRTRLSGWTGDTHQVPWSAGEAAVASE